MLADDPLRVLVWSEGTVHDPLRTDPQPGEVYPNDVNAAVAERLNGDEGVVARTASLDDPGQGVTADALADADVLVWWSHLHNDEVTAETVDRVEEYVTDGLGFIALHGAHRAPTFMRLSGSTGSIGDGSAPNGPSERIAVQAPDHPIARGVEAFTIPEAEAYPGPLSLPDRETVVFRGHFDNGTEFDAGVTFRAGAGRGFYFQPGHEQFRIYHQPAVVRVLLNAVRWAAGAE